LIGDSPGYVPGELGAKHSFGNGTGRLTGRYESQFSYETRRWDGVCVRVRVCGGVCVCVEAGRGRAGGS